MKEEAGSKQVTADEKRTKQEVFICDLSQNLLNVAGLLNTLLHLHDSGLGLEEPNPTAIMLLTQDGLRHAIETVDLSGNDLMKHFGNVEGIVQYIPVGDDGE